MQTSEFKPKDFIPVTTNIHSIACAKSWAQLETQEQLYAYYMARAAWQGSRICWFQRSAESPGLLVLLYSLFKNGIQQVRDENPQLSESEWKQLLAYSAAVFQNCGNFKSFGDTKFVPEIHPSVFRSVVSKHAHLLDIWEQLESEVYDESDPLGRIGFRDENGQTSYYSSNVTSKDSKFIDDFCQVKKISPLNTRLFKNDDGSFELKICSQFASADKMAYLGEHEHEGVRVNVTAADFVTFMADVVTSMSEAVKYAANENQKAMVVDYIEHFKFGE